MTSSPSTQPHNRVPNFAMDPLILARHMVFPADSGTKPKYVRLLPYIPKGHRYAVSTLVQDRCSDTWILKYSVSGVFACPP